MPSFKASFKYRKLVASLNILYDNRLNTEVQKQNKTQIKKLQTKAADSLNLAFIPIHFFN